MIAMQSHFSDLPTFLDLMQLDCISNVWQAVQVRFENWLFWARPFVGPERTNWRVTDEPALPSPAQVHGGIAHEPARRFLIK